MDKYVQLGDEAWAFIDKRARELGVIDSEGSTRGSVIFLGIYPKSGNTYHTWGYYLQSIERGFAQGCAIAEAIYGEGPRETTLPEVSESGVDVPETSIGVSGLPRSDGNSSGGEDSVYRNEGP